MNQDRTITIKIPEALISAAFRLARAEEVSPGEFIRSALAERVAEQADAGYRDPPSVLRRALRRHFSSASNWIDLQRRLRSERFVLREGEGDLWLYTWPLERRLLPLAKLGFDRDELTLTYGTPFPTHGVEVAKMFRSRRKAA